MHMSVPQTPLLGPSESTDAVGVIIADNHPLTVSGLRSAIADQKDIEVLAECSDRESLAELVRNHAPDVLLLSSEMLHENLDELQQVVSETQGTHVILLTGRRDFDFVREALRCGARGVFQRERLTRLIPKAIREVTNGGLWFERAVTDRILGEMLHKKKTGPDEHERRIASITKRESEVIELICEGLRNKEISSRLHISEATVSHHLTSIFRKLEVEDRISLVIYAVKQRLVIL
jgi:two-component system, NarL family, response regulator DegU